MAAVLQSLFEKEPQNATFIIFDVHGEYKQAFSAHSKRITRDHKDQGADIFILPPSFLSFEEWASLLRPSSQSQKPALEKALETLDPKSFHNVEELLPSPLSAAAHPAAPASSLACPR